MVLSGNAVAAPVTVPFNTPSMYNLTSTALLTVVIRCQPVNDVTGVLPVKSPPGCNENRLVPPLTARNIVIPLLAHKTKLPVYTAGPRPSNFINIDIV